jgi:dephospho-CoA kinase
MFEELKVPVYYSDDEAKKLMSHSKRLRKNIIALFGEKAYNESGLNRAYLADIVFRDEDSLHALNALVHPEVENHFRQWLLKQNAPYGIQENPLLFEKNLQDEYDAVITVAAPLDLRVERVMKRDGFSRKQVMERINNQMDQEYKILHASYVIENTGSLKDCRKAVRAIHQHILSTIP